MYIWERKKGEQALGRRRVEELSSSITSSGSSSVGCSTTPWGCVLLEGAGMDILGLEGGAEGFHHTNLLSPNGPSCSRVVQTKAAVWFAEISSPLVALFFRLCWLF